MKIHYVLMSLILFLFISPLAFAQNGEVVTSDEIKEALTQMPRSRGLGATRQIKVRPSISLNVAFESNSVKINGTGEAQLDELARALQSPELANKRYAVDGHTDGKGSAEMNQKLSELRAGAVKKYLVDRYGVSDSRLVAKGYGLTKLLISSDPFAAHNRRVEIVELP